MNKEKPLKEYVMDGSCYKEDALKLFNNKLKRIEVRLKEVLTPQLFHEIYERQARSSGWETHKDCKLKPFDELPETNQETMIMTLYEINKKVTKIFKEEGELE